MDYCIAVCRSAVKQIKSRECVYTLFHVSYFQHVQLLTQMYILSQDPQGEHTVIAESVKLLLVCTSHNIHNPHALSACLFICYGKTPPTLLLKTCLKTLIKLLSWLIRLWKRSFELVCEKTNNLDSDQVRHKPGCTVTEDGQKLEILDISRRKIVLSVF